LWAFLLSSSVGDWLRAKALDGSWVGFWSVGVANVCDEKTYAAKPSVWVKPVNF